MTREVATPRSILIVEDDPVAGDLFKRSLEHAGYVARVATDTERAADELLREIPDAVILDWHLPGSDGIAFLGRLRAARVTADLAVAIVTGDYFMDESIARDIAALGARLYFKPLWEEDLLQVAADLFAQPGEPRP